MQALTSIICTVFYVGKVPFAPGTFGSIAGVIFALFIGFDVITMLIMASLLFVVGYIFSDIYSLKIGVGDPKEVVIDEVVGVLITLAIAFWFVNGFFPVYYSRETYFLLSHEKPIFRDAIALFATILFRFFDITKPWIIKKIDNEVHGGMGIMLDDVVAGIFAGIAFIILAPFGMLMVRIFIHCTQ